jgi:hypothetical protein
MAVILVAAASAYDANFERLRTMTAAERTRLLEKLREFDLRLTPEQQSAVRDLDRQLSGLSADQRAHYLSVLRRYHVWLNSLPEPRQNELAAKPPGERLALIRAMVKQHPVPAGDSPPILRVIEPGEYSPMEVASAYKIWEVLNPKQRADLEKENAEHARREALFRIGARRKKAIPRETTPPDFDEEQWVNELRAERAGPRGLAMLENMAKAKGAAVEAVRKRVEALLPEIQRRGAINLYVSKTQVRPVDPDRLAKFIAALPPWIPPSFDSLSPDEARRRMTFAYRLVFPGTEEIGVAKKAAGGASKGRGTPAPKAGTPPKEKPKPADGGEEAAPF